MSMSKGKENKPHIGIFGRRNNGKSTLINRITGLDLAIVSPIPGTTTDPVKKSVEIFGVGPAILIDTAGIDDEGELGELRIRKSLQTIRAIDLAILVLSDNTFGKQEEELIRHFRQYEVPWFMVHGKNDLSPLNHAFKEQLESDIGVPVVAFSSLDDNTEILTNQIRASMPEGVYNRQGMLQGIIGAGDYVLLVTPIDSEAPEGRMILPQVQALREVLDNHAICIILRETELESFFKEEKIRPKLVITDSQVFPKADASIPKDIPLTSFSIVLARQKGDFEAYMRGTPKIGDLKDNDRVLSLESCTHHVCCDDIGRVKIPRWLTNYTGRKLEYDIVAGLNRIERPITDYALVIQCGGCMITRKQLHQRLKPAIDAGIPVTNYGMAIAYVHGIYNRAIAPFAKQAKGVDYL